MSPNHSLSLCIFFSHRSVRKTIREVSNTCPYMWVMISANSTELKRTLHQKKISLFNYITFSLQRNISDSDLRIRRMRSFFNQTLPKKFRKFYSTSLFLSFFPRPNPRKAPDLPPPQGMDLCVAMLQVAAETKVRHPVIDVPRGRSCPSRIGQFRRLSVLIYLILRLFPERKLKQFYHICDDVVAKKNRFSVVRYFQSRTLFSLPMINKLDNLLFKRRHKITKRQIYKMVESTYCGAIFFSWNRSFSPPGCQWSPPPFHHFYDVNRFGGNSIQLIFGLDWKEKVTTPVLCPTPKTIVPSFFGFPTIHTWVGSLSLHHFSGSQGGGLHFA